MDRVPRILLFGPGTVVDTDGAALPVGGPRQRALLTSLALRPGSPVPVPDLIAALWGEEPPASVRNALQVHVSGLRHLLDPLGLHIHRDGATYSLGCGIGDVDLLLFDALATSGQSMLRAGNAGRARQLLERAISLASAPLLAGLDLTPTLEHERRMFQDRRRAARLDVVVALCQDHDPHRAEKVAAAIVADDRLDEAAWSRLMLAQYHAGHQHRALETYQQARTTLLEELGVEPSPHLSAVHQEILNHHLPRRDPYDLAVSYCWLVQPLLVQGRIGEARACLDQGLELAARHPLGSVGVMFSADAAVVELAEGKPAGAIGLATAVLEGLGDEVLPYRMVALRCLALGHHQLGNRRLGARFLGAADALAERLGLAPEAQWPPVFDSLLSELRNQPDYLAEHAAGATDPEGLARWWMATVEKE